MDFPPLFPVAAVVLVPPDDLGAVEDLEVDDELEDEEDDDADEGSDVLFFGLLSLTSS